MHEQLAAETHKYKALEEVAEKLREDLATAELKLEEAVKYGVELLEEAEAAKNDVVSVRHAWEEAEEKHAAVVSELRQKLHEEMQEKIVQLKVGGVRGSKWAQQDAFQYYTQFWWRREGRLFGAALNKYPLCQAYRGPMRYVCRSCNTYSMFINPPHNRTRHGRASNMLLLGAG